MTRPEAAVEDRRHTPSGSGGRWRCRVRLPEDVYRAILQAARTIRKHYSIPDRRVADRAGRLFAHALFPRRAGRPKRKDVTRALQLEAQGMSRKMIYVLLGKNTRDQQHDLREAIRQRRQRLKRRKTSAPVTPPPCAVAT